MEVVIDTVLQPIKTLSATRRPIRALNAWVCIFKVSISPVWHLSFSRQAHTAPDGGPAQEGRSLLGKSDLRVLDTHLHTKHMKDDWHFNTMSAAPTLHENLVVEGSKNTEPQTQYDKTLTASTTLQDFTRRHLPRPLHARKEGHGKKRRTLSLCLHRPLHPL